MGQSKNKECKKHYHSAMNVFQVCIGIVYNSFILELGISIISISTALLLWRYCKIWTSFKTLVSKKATIWQLKKSHSNDRLLEKITSSSYHMEQKTFIEASCIYNIHTGEKNFCSCYFWRFSFRFGQIKKLEVYFGLYQSSFTFIEKKRPNKYCLCEVDLISYM